MEEVLFVTGANSAYFLMACLLMHSIKRVMPGARFHVLDFGLKPSEKDYLTSKGALATLPGVRVADENPYYLKTKMINFIKRIPGWNTALWIDSDIFVGNDFSTRLRNLLEQMEQENYDLAASPEAVIQEIFDEFPRLDFGPFRQELKNRGLSTELEYYNSGFVIFRSKAFLQDWEDLGERMLPHALFDQNAFNILAHDGYRTARLPGEIWNLHGRDLDEGRLAAILGGTEKPVVFHLTSNKASHVQPLQLRFLEQDELRYNLRLFVNKSLRDKQGLDCRQFFHDEMDALKDAGVVGASASLASLRIF
jgi:hypothetical protein